MRDRTPFARIARNSGRVICSRTGRASRWRTAPAFLLSLAFSVSAAPTTIDADRTPRERTIEVLTSAYELHEPTNAPRNQQYGGQVALSGDGRTLAVADLWYYGGSEWPWYGSGAVYVYARSNGAWALQAKLEPPNARGYDYFGADIALSFDGRTLAVGAQNEGYDAPSQDAGPGASSCSRVVTGRGRSRRCCKRRIRRTPRRLAAASKSARVATCSRSALRTRRRATARRRRRGRRCLRIQATWIAVDAASGAACAQPAELRSVRSRRAAER